MTNLIKFFAVATIAVVGCGDNNKSIDAAVHHDAPNPGVPTLGAQMDRLGRPAVNTAMNHAFDPACTSASCAAKDTYNQDATPAGWVAAYAGLGGTADEFAFNLAILDGLDSTGTTDGCGNAVLYNGNPAGGGTAAATSYDVLAGILANDQLFIDTTVNVCDLASHSNYLAVEFNVVTGVPNTTCGGRAPLNDVIDTSYTALAVGILGFSTDGQFTPAFTDGVPPHTDENNDTFPFFGIPH